MNGFNIYMAGVGGQGIGLLSETLLRAADHAGLPVKSVDTHGLAQRGGVVISQLRIGLQAHSPLIATGEADLVVALERHEAARGVNEALRDGGILIYYDTVWQPLDVRLNRVAAVDGAELERHCQARGITVHRLCEPDLPDPRQQNMVVLAGIARHHLVPEVTRDHILQALEDLMQGPMLAANRRLFQSQLAKPDGD
jgi:indolepyruvate ferredoxin oxidoreductase, beta subunit